MATATYTVADSKTDQVAVSGKYRTLLPTDVTAASLADLGGAHQTGTFAIAANASPRQAQFSVTTTPNTTVDGDRSFDVEIYDVTPAGTTLTVSKVRTKIVEDDAASTAIYPTASTADTGFISAGSVDEWVLTTTVDDTAYEIFYGCLDNDGSPGGSFKAINSTHITAYVRDSAGAEGQDNQMIYKDIPNVAGGVPLVVRYKRSTGTLTITINNVLVRSGGTTSPTGGAFLRFKTGGAARPAVTVTAA